MTAKVRGNVGLVVRAKRAVLRGAVVRVTLAVVRITSPLFLDVTLVTLVEKPLKVCTEAGATVSRLTLITLPRNGNAIWTDENTPVAEEEGIATLSVRVQTRVV